MIVGGIDTQSRLPFAAKIASLAALNSKIFSHPGRVLLQDVIVFPQRIALPFIRQQNALQIRMPGKYNSEHVKHFAFLPIRRGPDTYDARYFFGVRRMHFQPQALVPREGVQIENHIETLLTLRPIDGRQIRKHVEFFFVAQVQRHFRQSSAIHGQDGLLAVLGRFQKRRTELGAKSLDQFVVERSLQHYRRFGFLGLVSHGPEVRRAAVNRLRLTNCNSRAAENSNVAFLTHAANRVNHNSLRTRWWELRRGGELRLTPTQERPSCTATDSPRAEFRGIKPSKPEHIPLGAQRPTPCTESPKD